MNFGGIQQNYSDYKTAPMVILPVPFDATSTWIKGGTMISRRKLVGFDVVELCPIEDNKASDFLAYKLIYQLLSYQFKD